MKTRKNVKSRRNRRKSAKSRCRKHRYTLRGGLKISDKPGLAFNIPGFGKYKSEARREHEDKKQKEEEEKKELRRKREEYEYTRRQASDARRQANEANERANERAWELANPEEAARRKELLEKEENEEAARSNLEMRRQLTYDGLRGDDAYRLGMNIDDYLDKYS